MQTEIRITTGTYNTLDYRIVKNYKSQKAAQKFVTALGWGGELFDGLSFSAYGKTYSVSIG